MAQLTNILSGHITEHQDIGTDEKVARGTIINMLDWSSRATYVFMLDYKACMYLALTLLCFPLPTRVPHHLPGFISVCAC